MRQRHQTLTKPSILCAPLRLCVKKQSPESHRAATLPDAHTLVYLPNMPESHAIHGPLRAIEDAFADAVVAARPSDPLAPLTVLVGQTLLKRYLPRMLARRGIAHINVNFVMPDQLALQLATGVTSSGHVSPAQERLLVRLTAAMSRPYFHDIARGDGFTRELLRLFRDLERGGFTPDTFASTLTAASLQSEKFADLAAMFSEYVQRRADAGLAGTSDFYGSVDTSTFEGPLLVYGLWDPAASQRTLIQRIASTQDCTVFLPATGLDIDGAHADFRTWLTSNGFTEQAVEQSIDHLTTYYSETFFSLTFSLFRQPQGPIEASNISLVSAPDTVREVWEAARACLQWAREGIPFHEMAVVYRNANPYRALVAEIFTEAGLNEHSYIHQGRPMCEHPLGRRLLALLELIADTTFSRQRVMEFVTETRVPQVTRDRHERFRPAEWEGFTREAGVLAGIDQWRTRLTNHANQMREKAKDERFQWLEQHAGRVASLISFADDLHARVSQHPTTATWDEHLAYVRGMATEYAADLDPLLDALKDLTSLSEIAPTVTFEQFLQAVRDDLDTRDVSDVLGEPKREFGRRGIAVLDASSLRHMRFRAVYLLGAAERAWPPPKRPDPLLLEHERTAINAAASDSAALPLRTQPDDEALTFHLAAQAADERLFVSYARAEAGGSGRHLPSYFFRSLAQTIEGREMSVAEVDDAVCVRRMAAGRLAHDDAMLSVTAAEYDRALVKSALYDGAVGVIDALSQFDVHNTMRPRGAIARAVVARRERWSRGFTGFDGVMIAPEAVARAASLAFAREKAISPSRLETYAACPYRYFLKYGLGVEDLDEPESTERIDALERGSMIHDILEQFLKKLGHNDLPNVDRRVEHLDLLLKIAEEAGKDRHDRGVTGRPLIWELDRRKINEDLVRWYDKEIEDGDYGRVQPGAFEAGFGGVSYGFGKPDPISSEAPLELTIGDRGVLLQGRIDRVDFDDDHTSFRVIDYKTGKSSPKTAFDRGRALQLPIYLRAAAQLLGIPPESGEAQYYYCTSRGGFERRTISGDTLTTRQADFDQVLATIVDGVDGGYFAPFPGKGAQNCMWCDYKLVCDSRIERISNLKTSDPRGAAFIALQDIS